MVIQASPAAFHSVLEAYAHARVDRPDKHLERQARLAGEFKLVTALLTAVGSKNQKGIAACEARLRRLAADTSDDEPDDKPVVPTAPTAPAVPVVPVFVEHSDADAAEPPVETTRADETAPIVPGQGADATSVGQQDDDELATDLSEAPKD